MATRPCVCVCESVFVFIHGVAKFVREKYWEAGEIMLFLSKGNDCIIIKMQLDFFFYLNHPHCTNWSGILSDAILMKLYLQFFCIWVFLWDTETLWAKYEISLYWGSCFKSLLPELCFFIIILVFFLNQQCVTPECSRKKVNCCETMSWLQSGPSPGPSVGGVGRAKWLIEQTCHNLLSFLFCQLIMKS